MGMRRRRRWMVLGVLGVLAVPACGMASDGVEQAQNDLDWTIAPEEELTTTTIAKEATPPSVAEAAAPAGPAELDASVPPSQALTLALPDYSAARALGAPEPKSVGERVAAKRAQDDMNSFQFMVRNSSRFNGEVGDPVPVCTALGDVRSAGYQYLLIAASDPDVESLRTALTDLVNKLEHLRPLVPQDLPEGALDPASIGPIVLAGIADATTPQEIVDFFTPYIDEYTPIMQPVYIEKGTIECPEFLN